MIESFSFAAVAGELKACLDDQCKTHTRGRPYLPSIQDKIERWHRSIKIQVLLEYYCLPGDVESSIKRFVGNYNHERYYESLDNLIPADVIYGRGQQTLDRRNKIKAKTLVQCE